MTVLRNISIILISIIICSQAQKVLAFLDVPATTSRLEYIQKIVKNNEACMTQIKMNYSVEMEGGG